MVFGTSLKERRAAILSAGLHGQGAARKKNISLARENARMIQRESKLYGRKLQGSPEKKQAAECEAAGEAINTFLEEITGSRSAKQMWEAVQRRFDLVVSIALKWKLADVSTVSQARAAVREHDKKVA
ncbi:TPA: hypothetical protein HA278_06895 [Candidatus Woesearchaeota archaeon]|nr:hypothetical protein [Candidatus Woesearchaeota archaeon]